jgi:hypothetical protein
MAQPRKRPDVLNARKRAAHNRPNGGKRAGAGRWGSGPLQCQTCQHPERGRIDYLLAGGASIRATAKQFGITFQKLSGHYQKHVSDRYKKMVAAQQGPSFDKLLTEATEASAETLDLLTMLIRGHSSRWAIAMEAGDDRNMASHSQRILQAVEMRARITLELQPEARNLTVNNFLMRDAAELSNLLRNHPAAVAQLEEWYAQRMKLIEHEPQGAAD